MRALIPNSIATPLVLLLQGPRSPFFGHLADALAERGAGVERVLFCAGDELFWRGRPALRWRDHPEAWPDAVRALYRERGVTDVVGLGDGRFWHRTAFAAARAVGVRVHVLEQGYLRPGWLTLEPDRLGAWQFDPNYASARDRTTDPSFRSSFTTFALMDVAHHLANLTLGPLRYPHYRTHELWHPAREWLGWAGKGFTWPHRRRAREAAQRRIDAAPAPLFLFALQLETDFQVRDHGPPGGLVAALRDVLESFANSSPETARLVVKQHPLDPGLTPWRRIIDRSPAASRVIWLDGGNIETLLPKLRGVVTVNSTVGLTALRHGLPVHVLGRAIYGALTDDGPLERFWQAPGAPNRGQVDAFCTALASSIQVPGAFDGEGMVPGARAVAGRLL